MEKQQEGKGPREKEKEGQWQKGRIKRGMCGWRRGRDGGGGGRLGDAGKGEAKHMIVGTSREPNRDATSRPKVDDQKKERKNTYKRKMSTTRRTRKGDSLFNVPKLEYKNYNEMT